MTQSAEYAIAARRVPGSSPGHSLVLAQNLGTCVSCERIGKKLKPVIALACASVITENFWNSKNGKSRIFHCLGSQNEKKCPYVTPDYPLTIRQISPLPFRLRITAKLAYTPTWTK